MANDGVDLDLRAGEIHALLGANGAGKSTLMSILSGAYALDSGTIRIRGEPLRIRSPSDALAAGIGMVHQHVMLVPSMTVAENLAVGGGGSSWVLRRRDLESRVETLARRLGFEVPASRRVADLSMAQRQQVEILRNLARDVTVLILDEPTAVLTPQESEGLFRVLRTLADGGSCVVFISHKLDEVMAIADRVTVLREGRVVRTAPASDCRPVQLVADMVGEGGEAPPLSRRAAPAAQPTVELRDVVVDDARGVRLLAGVSLAVSPGEVVGIAGLAGAGQSALAEVLAGLRTPSAGSVRICGREMAGQPSRRFLRLGVRYVPGDRRGRGLAPDLAVAENAVLTWLDLPCLGRGGYLSRGAVCRFGAMLARSEGIQPPDPGRPAGMLSGGNMQRLIVGRETRESPRLLVAEYPLRGLDVQATGFVRARLCSLASEGTAVVFISEDLDELLTLCDRILVLVRGRIVADRCPASTSRLRLGLDMMGHRGS